MSVGVDGHWGIVGLALWHPVLVYKRSGAVIL